MVFVVCCGFLGNWWIQPRLFRGKKKSCLEIQKTSISKPNRNDLIKNIVNSLQSIQKFNKKNDIHCKWVDSLAILILSIIGH